MGSAPAWPCTSPARACTWACAPATAPSWPPAPGPRRTTGTWCPQRPRSSRPSTSPTAPRSARFAAAVVTAFGRIDLWVNNAGLLGPIGPLAGTGPDDDTAARSAEIARTIEVNVTGVLNGTAVFAEHVRAREGTGTLVNISSGAATNPYEGWAAYCASKAAVDQLTRVVALEEARHGLAAYAVSPGLVDTDMQAAIRATEPASFPQVDRFRRAATEHRFNSPAWVAEHILALAFGPERPGTVVVRVPDQAVASGLAG